MVATPVVIDESGQEVRAIGTLAAAQEVTVYPQVTGIVAEIAFTPGSEVAKGAELVRLDDADERIAVDMAEIALTTANAAHDRAERLGTTKNITAVDLENARAAAQKAEIDLKAAKLALAKRTITAPFAGVTGLTDLSVGDLATTAKPITTVNDMTSLTVSFDVAERVAGLVAIGQEVDAQSDALIGRTIKGRIVAIDNRIDAQARTLKLKASLPNEANILKPGMAITVMLTFPGQPRPSIPSLAIQWDRKGSFVWKVDGDVVHRTPIQIAERRSGVVTVSGDLKAGDLVVTEGVLRLREGAKVALAGDEGVRPPARRLPMRRARRDWRGGRSDCRRRTGAERLK